MSLDGTREYKPFTGSVDPLKIKVGDSAYIDGKPNQIVKVQTISRNKRTAVVRIGRIGIKVNTSNLKPVTVFLSNEDALAAEHEDYMGKILESGVPQHIIDYYNFAL